MGIPRKRYECFTERRRIGSLNLSKDKINISNSLHLAYANCAALRRWFLKKRPVINPTSQATWTRWSALVPKVPAPVWFSHQNAQTHRLPIQQARPHLSHDRKNICTIAQVQSPEDYVSAFDGRISKTLRLYWDLSEKI